MHYQIYKYQKILSTNQLAMDWVSKGIATEGQLIRAEFQTAGRGTGLHVWESENGCNLTCSLLLTPTHIEPSRQFLITQIISLTLKKVVEAEIPNVDVKIKWPNDIYTGDKKIAGILIQNVIQANKISFSIVGIGLNVNQKKFISDALNPVSLIHYKKEETNRDELLNRFLSTLNLFYKESLCDTKNIEKEYVKSLYRFQLPAFYIAEGKRFKARIIGITEYGRLVLQDEKGEKRIFNFKELEFIIV